MMKRKYIVYVVLLALVIQSLFTEQGMMRISYAKSKSEVESNNTISKSVKSKTQENSNAINSVLTVTEDNKEVKFPKFQYKDGLITGDIEKYEIYEVSREQAEHVTLYDKDIASAMALGADAESDTDPSASTYGKSMLGDPSRQGIYEQIVNACKSFQDGNMAPTEINDMGGTTRHAAYRLDLTTYHLSQEIVYHIMASVDYDNPQFFWLEKGLYVYINSSHEVEQLLIVCGDDFTDATERHTLVNNMETRIQEYLSGFGDRNYSDYEKELILHDKLIEKVSYAFIGDTRIPESALWAHSIVGVFGPDHNKVVCEGYAKAFQLLLNRAGIENIFVVGTGNGGEHAWNMVKLNNDWYNVDTTWDDQEDEQYRYTYFNMNKNNFNNHSTGGVSLNWCYSIPDSTGTTYQPLHKVTYNNPDNVTVKLYKSTRELIQNNSKVVSGSAITVEVTPTINTTTDFTLNYTVNGENPQSLTRNTVSGNTIYKSSTPIHMLNDELSVEVIMPPMYTVDFYENPGESPYRKFLNVMSGTTVVPWPTDPTKTGYMFEGWYTDSETEVTSSTSINDNMSLYANWVQKLYTSVTATYNNSSNPRLPVGSTIDGSKFIVRKYYNNRDYDLESDFRFTPSEINNVGDNLITISCPGTQATATVIIQGYEEITNKTVTFETGGGPTVEPITNITPGSTITLPARPKKLGYYFDGWYLYNTYEVEFNPSTPIHQDTTLYAHWIRLTDDPINTIQKMEVTYSGGNVYLGNSIDRTKLSVVITDKNNDTHEVTDYTLSRTRIESIGNNTITVTYAGLTKTFTVSGVSTTTSGTTTNYRYITYMTAGYYGGPVEVGSYVDSNNVTVTVVYNDNTVEYSRNFTLSNSYIYITGDNTVYVNYGGYTQPVTVRGVPKGSLTTTTPVTQVMTTSTVSSSSSLTLSSTVAGGYQGNVSPKINVTSNQNYSIVSAEIEERTLTTAISGKEISNTNKLSLSVNSVNSQVLSQLYKSDVSVVYLNVCLPVQYVGRGDIQLSNIDLDSSTVTKLRDSKKKLIVQYIGTTYNSETDKTTYTNPLCSMVIDGKELLKTTTCNVSLRVSSIGKDYEIESSVNDYLKEEDRGTGVVVTLGQDGELSKAGKVIVDVGGSLGSVKGDKVYAYGYNKETNKLEELPKTTYVVDKDQNIILNVESYSKYVILPDETEQAVVSLASRATVSKYLIAKKGKMKQITVAMPEGIRTSDVKLKYSTNNKNLATVSSKGKVTTKKKGTVVITTTVTYGNKSKKFKTEIKIK